MKNKVLKTQMSFGCVYVGGFINMEDPIFANASADATNLLIN